jgi:hypothetical protein
MGDAIPRKIKSGKIYREWMDSEGQIIVDDVMQPDVFHSLFDGKGTKIQPTKENKPTSVVTIINFTWEQLKHFLGEFAPARGGHECQLWVKGRNFMRLEKSERERRTLNRL